MNKNISLIVTANNKNQLTDVSSKIVDTLSQFDQSLNITEQHLDESLGMGKKEVALTFMISIAANLTTKVVEQAINEISELAHYTVEIIELKSKDNAPNPPERPTAAVHNQAGLIRPVKEKD